MSSYEEESVRFSHRFAEYEYGADAADVPRFLLGSEDIVNTSSPPFASSSRVT